MIEIKNLEKRYGNDTAVNDLTFTVKKGEIVGLLGPNGAGKSTTMNMMTGYLPITKGNIQIGQYDMGKNPTQAKKQIGYLPEHPPLYLDFTVKEYLNFVAGLKHIPKAQKKQTIEYVKHTMELETVERRLIRQLSKGYKQRIGIAAALLGEPEVVILDEPTAGLDPKQMTMIREEVKAIKQNHSILWSSHILSEVSAICDRILILHHGTIIASGTVQELMNHSALKMGVYITIKAQEEEVLRYLNSIKEVESVTKQPSDPGFLSALLYTKKEEEIRENIFFFCAKRKWPIYEMRKEQITLEDTFLALTKEQESNRQGGKR